MLNSTSSELQQLKDMSSHQKKRINEMLTNLLKDLSEIGTALGGSDNEIKVSRYNNAVSFRFNISAKILSLINIFICSILDER